MFAIKVRSALQIRHSIYTDLAIKRGQAVMHDSGDSTYATDRPTNPYPKAALGSDTKVVGLAVRDVNSVGATLEDSISPWPGGINQNRSTAEAPDKFPCYTGLEPLPVEIELEEPLAGNAGFVNDHLITSGTGAVTDATAIDSELAYNAGKLRLKQAGEVARYILTAQLAPISGAQGGTGWVRIRARLVGA